MTIRIGPTRKTARRRLYSTEEGLEREGYQAKNKNDHASNIKSPAIPAKKAKPKITSRRSFGRAAVFTAFCFMLSKSACNLSGICSWVKKLISERFMAIHLRSYFYQPKKLNSPFPKRSEEHTSELQSRENLVCRL